MKYLITVIGTYVILDMTGIAEVFDRQLTTSQDIILGILVYFIYKSGQMDHNVVITKEE